MANTVPERSALRREDTWRLEDICESNDLWRKDCDELSARAEKFKEFAGKLGERESLLAALCEYFYLNRRLEAIYAYARMRRDEDNRDSTYQALTARAQTVLVAAGTVSSFLTPELLAQSEEYIDGAIADPAFAEYAIFLGEIKRMRPHTLSAAEERIIAMAGEIASAPHTVFSMLNDADMKFPRVKDESGDEIELTHAGFIPLMMCKNRDVRAGAFAALYETYKSYSATIPALYFASVQSDIFSSRTARHNSALEAALYPDAVPVSVYSNLVDSIHGHLPSLNRFVTRNGKLIGVDKMRMIDLYVPAVEGFDIKLPFAKAYELVEECLSPLGEDYVATLRRARAERWIDPFENVGKSSGAYSWGTYDAHPFVLMNYKENLDSVLTLAHELGHAMHSYYSSKAQAYPNAEYSLFVAEVASTCNEVLVLEALKKRYDSREAQAFLTYHLLDGFRTTVFRQTMFAEFERDAHALAEKGEPLTAENLNELYAKLNKTYYSSVEQDELIAYEWMRIPHFYRAFYVYKYATGFCAAMALARGIIDEGAPAVARYRKFLSLGGSVHPIDALRIAGVDMEKPESVESALAAFDSLVADYERLTD